MTPQDADRARFEGLAAEDRARFQRESAQKDQEVGILNEIYSGVIGNSRGLECVLLPGEEYQKEEET